MAELSLGQAVRLNDGLRGIVRFIGQTLFAPGEWVGVELEERKGKNDGSVQGERYFDCAMGYGMFVRPVTVTVLSQPPPAQKPAAGTAAGAAGARRSGRPSSLFSTASSRSGSGDPALGKRMSLNAPSPSPGPRTSRPSSTLRSPTRSPTKQLANVASSASSSRTPTPLNSRAPPTGLKGRPSAGASRTSMGPPALPASKAVRPPSLASAAPKVAPPSSRPVGSRLSLTAGRPAPGVGVRSDKTKSASAGGSTSGTESPSAARGARSRIASPQKSSDDEILSPQPRSPVQAKTLALERLTSSSSPTATRSKATAPSTPAAAAAAATTTSRPASNNAAAREIEDLKAKLRVLERKRMEDRDKLKSMDKIQAERDKFEAIIQKLQTKYQPQQQEINELRRQLKEAEERLESVEALQAEHETAMELATLDREMAEETAEVLKAELDALKQKSEELELEVEILREENAEFTKGMSPEERASTGWLQMERNNERLREALLRLRDLTQQQEEELRDQIRSLEADLREFAAVREQHELAQQKLAQAEATVEDLRQQLDTALGAEDMIEDLTERNMSQAEQIEELKAVIEDLESLKEINDELEINHVQNEREMQEELDFKDSVIVEQARRAAQQEEALADMEYTLSRFRELVTSLQGDLEDMRASHAVTEAESEQLSSRSRAMLDLNMKLQISAAKAQAKAVDLELRRLEAQEAEQHLEIVKLFLPDAYDDADRDSVLALLRFRRLAFKANLLNGFVRERINGQPHPEHEDDVFVGCDVTDKLTWLSAMCDRFVNDISHCSLDRFARYRGALYELEPVERALNAWIEGLRRDELRERQCATELQRTMALMTHLAEVHISADDLQSYADDVHMRSVLMQSHLESAAVTFATMRNMTQRVIGGGTDGEEGDEAGEEDNELAQYFARKTDAVVTQTRSTKVIAGKVVRALEDLKTRSLSLLPDTRQAFEEAEAAARELADLARQMGLDLHQLLHQEGRTEPYTYAEVQSCLHKTVSNVTGVGDSDLFSTYLSKLRVLTSQISDLANRSTDLTQTQEFERSAAPWLLRSEELRRMKTMPVDAEEELRRLKEEYGEARRTISEREQSLGTAQLKIETLEARMRDAKAKAARMVEMEAQIERAGQQVAALKEEMEKQDRELKQLEADRDKWKKVASDSRLVAGGAEGPGEGGALRAAGRERAVATAREMDALREEIASLQAAVRYLREESRRARTTEQGDHEWLAEPLRRRSPPAAEQRRALVAAEGRDALGELVRLATSARVFDLKTLPRDKLAWRPARSTPQYHAARQMEDYAAWKSWEEAVVKKTREVVAMEGRSSGRSHLEGRGGPAAAGRNVAARLHIRLPGQVGKGDPSEMGREVQIVGSAEWEGLQGRLVA